MSQLLLDQSLADAKFTLFAFLARYAVFVDKDIGS